MSQANIYWYIFNDYECISYTATQAYWMLSHYQLSNPMRYHLFLNGRLTLSSKFHNAFSVCVGVYIGSKMSSKHVLLNSTNKVCLIFFSIFNFWISCCKSKCFCSSTFWLFHSLSGAGHSLYCRQDIVGYIYHTDIQFLMTTGAAKECLNKNRIKQELWTTIYSQFWFECASYSKIRKM